MRLGALWGTPIRISPLLLPAAAVAVWMGESATLIIMTLSVLLHELCHVAAARWMRMHVLELELMPFGGAARIDALWLIRPGQLILIALAGPICNLLIFVGASALCWWELVDVHWAVEVMRANLLLFLFNLIPALPLDGGRVLCGLLSLRMPPGKAARIGVWSGRAIGLALMAAGCFSAIGGKLNLTLIMAGGYLMLSGKRELMQADSAAIRSFLDRERELRAEGVMPMEMLAAACDAPIRDAALRMRPRRVYSVAVYDGQMRLLGYVSERRMIRALIEGDTRPIGALLVGGGEQQRPEMAV